MEDNFQLVVSKKESKAVCGVCRVPPDDILFPSSFGNNKLAYVLTNILIGAYNYKIKEIASICNVSDIIVILWSRGDPRVYMSQEHRNILCDLIEKERKKWKFINVMDVI